MFGNSPIIDEWRIVIATVSGCYAVREYLLCDLRIPAKMIDRSWAESRQPMKNRDTWFETQVKLFRQAGMNGSLAECGVFRGNFAAKINAAKPENKLYLFDTFESFCENDMDNDINSGDVPIDMRDACTQTFKNTSVENVLSVLPYPEMAIVRKGLFPATAEGIDDDFMFVDLDFDLYQPILAGLRFFHPKMVPGGVIIIHDYFNPDFKGVERTVTEFVSESGVNLLAIGDTWSVAIVKQ